MVKGVERVMPHILVMICWPFVIAYAVYKAFLCVAWPPRSAPLVAGLGGAFMLAGNALYSLKARPEYAHFEEWDFAVFLLGVTLVIVPKLYGMATDRPPNTPK